MLYAHDANDITIQAVSNTSPYVITGSPEWSSSQGLWNAFDHQAGGSCWVTAQGIITNIYVTLDFGAGNPKAFNKISVSSSGAYALTAAPKNMIVKGSNDGANFTNIYTLPPQTGWGADEMRVFEFANSTAYRYFQLWITDTNGYPSYMIIGEIEICTNGALQMLQQSSLFVFDG